MIKNVLQISVLFVAMLVVAPTAQAQTNSEVLAQMDAIIAEMQKLRAEFATLANTTTATTPTPAVQGAATSKVLTQDLSYGVTNEDIAKIQRLLATDSEIYPYGVASGFFGPKTEEAIKNLQTRFGLEPVGVIGPATTELLEGWLAAYPSENYPEGVLTTRPTAAPAVAGASTSNTGLNQSEAMQILERLQAQMDQVTDDEEEDEEDATPTRSTRPSADNPAESIEVSYRGDSATVEIEYRDEDEYEDERFTIKADNEDDVIEELTFLTFLSESEIREVLSTTDGGPNGSGDEDEAEAALEEADDAIEDVEDEIEEADDDGERTSYSEDLLDEAKDLLDDAEDAFDDEDYDEAVEKAEEAIEKAEEAEDVIGKNKPDVGDIEDIKVQVTDVNEAEVVVEYEDNDFDDKEFTIEEDDREELIEEIAKELDLSESDVLRRIEFDYGDIDSIDVEIDDDEAEVEIEFESGVEASFDLEEDRENEIIEDIAELYDLSEGDVEDVIDFD